MDDSRNYTKYRTICSLPENDYNKTNEQLQDELKSLQLLVMQLEEEKRKYEEEKRCEEELRKREEEEKRRCEEEEKQRREEEERKKIEEKRRQEEELRKREEEKRRREEEERKKVEEKRKQEEELRKREEEKRKREEEEKRKKEEKKKKKIKIKSIPLAVLVVLIEVVWIFVKVLVVLFGPFAIPLIMIYIFEDSNETMLWLSGVVGILLFVRLFIFAYTDRFSDRLKKIKGNSLDDKYIFPWNK